MELHFYPNKFTRKCVCQAALTIHLGCSKSFSTTSIEMVFIVKGTKSSNDYSFLWNWKLYTWNMENPRNSIGNESAQTMEINCWLPSIFYMTHPGCQVQGRSPIAVTDLRQLHNHLRHLESKHGTIHLTISDLNSLVRTWCLSIYYVVYMGILEICLAKSTQKLPGKNKISRTVGIGDGGWGDMPSECLYTFA